MQIKVTNGNHILSFAPSYILFDFSLLFVNTAEYLVRKKQ